MTFHRPKFSAAFLTALMLLVAIGQGLLALLAMRDKSITADELAHITGGYTFNHWNDYRMHPENGLLPQRWQALPTSLAAVHYPDLSTRDWKEGNVWMTGHGFLYDLGNNYEWILFTARAMNTLFSIALVFLVGVWARYFFGWAGAWTAMFFSVFCPTMLAHAALATSDMAMAFFLVAAVSAYWWQLNDGRLRIVFLSAGVFGLACVAKYTAVLLLPLFLLMAVIRLSVSTPVRLRSKCFVSRGSKLGAVVGLTLFHGLAAAAMIWAFCGFRYQAFNPQLPMGEFTPTWDYVLSFGGLKAQVINLCRTWHLLPEGYLYGFSFVLKYADARGAFLDGDYSIYGWTSFFPKTFLYKTPPTLLLGLAAASVLFIFQARKKNLDWLWRHFYRASPLLLLFGVYWAVSLPSHLNIGHRHILPTYPVLYIFCGLLGWAAQRALQKSFRSGLAASVALVALLSWHVSITAKSYPHYLAYFSPFVGGSQEGYKHLADSSLDWGQDLPGLKMWLDHELRPGEPVYISYFGTGEPDYYGINAIRMPMIHGFRRERAWHWFEPGVYALSATMLQHVYMARRGPWTVKDERQYQELRQNDVYFRAFKNNPHADHAFLRGLTWEQWYSTWDDFEQLRFARLCHYLRARQPDAMIGYSILIFRVTQAEIDAALNGPVSELMHAIERASADSRP